MACFAMGLTACGGSESQSTPPPVSSVPPPPPPPINVKPTVSRENSDLSATVGIAFSYDATQGGQTFSDPDGDSLTYSIRINSADPRGLTSEGGNVTGTPTSLGSVNLTITATDPDGETAADNFSIVVGTQPEVRLGNSDQSVRIGAPFSYDASQNGRTFVDADRDSLTYTVSLSPDGQAFVSNGAIISGTAAVGGIITAVITATDDDGFTAQDSFNITILPRDSSQIFVLQETDIINVFVKGSVETSNKYLRYQFRRFDRPASRAVGWGWRLLHEASLNSDESFEIGTRLMRGGENFMAVREVGKTDFMGGTNHGDHIDSSFIMLIDGEEKAIDGTTRYIGSEVEFKQVGTLYEVDNPVANPTANVNTDFKMAFGVSTLSNRVEFTRPIELSTALITMLSSDRHVNGDVNNTLLTGTAKWSPAFSPFDVSMPGHNAPRVNADTIQLTGPSGYSYEVKITKGWDSTSQSFVNSGAAYNKLYFSPIGSFPSVGPGINFPSGHVIEVEAEYRLDTSN